MADQIDQSSPAEIISGPAARAAAITPSNTVNLARTSRGIYVGGAGDLVAVMGGVAITFRAVPVGTLLPIAASRINSTNTTATNLIALW